MHFIGPLFWNDLRINSLWFHLRCYAFDVCRFPIFCSCDFLLDDVWAPTRFWAPVHPSMNLKMVPRF